MFRVRHHGNFPLSGSTYLSKVELFGSMEFISVIRNDTEAPTFSSIADKWIDLE